MMPWKLDSDTLFWRRSCMVTSHGSMPAKVTAAAISLSPLLPSSLRMATLTFLLLLRTDPGVHSGLNGTFQAGASLEFCTACSDSTHSDAHWSFSSLNAVASHMALELDTVSCSTISPLTEIQMSLEAEVDPTTEAGTPALA